MIKKYFSVLILLSSFSIFGQIQVLHLSEDVGGGEYKFNENNLSCVTPDLRQKIDSVIHVNTQKYRAVSGIAVPMNTFFEWPIRKAVNNPYFGVWAISNYVDHDASYPNQVLDYNCGTRTYDSASGYNHQGTDIFLWPFSWDQFYNSQVEIIAAAPGTIIFKQDGNFDQSCSFNNNSWNAIYVQHGDGSIAMYGHMKENTLTTKNVGDYVQTGEFLGVVGSSGNSTGPHLHFEVFDSSNNLIDPFVGSCNNFNNTSWWVAQKTYHEPNINAVMIHDAPPVFNPCPQPADINERIIFEFGEFFYMATYFRDQVAGTSASFVLKDTNGNVINTWTRVFQNTYVASYWYYTFGIQSATVDVLDLVFEAHYNGITKSTAFQVVKNLGVHSVSKSKMKVYPNPFRETISISNDGLISSVSIYDLNGKLITVKKPHTTDLNIQTIDFAQGIYFVKITDETGKSILKKMIKN